MPSEAPAYASEQLWLVLARPLPATTSLLLLRVRDDEQFKWRHTHLSRHHLG